MEEEVAETAEISGPTVQEAHTPLVGFAVRQIKQNLRCGYCGRIFERQELRKYVYPVPDDPTGRIGKLACMACYGKL